VCELAVFDAMEYLRASHFRQVSGEMVDVPGQQFVRAAIDTISPLPTISLGFILRGSKAASEAVNHW
jgi:hypothetical protein